MKTTLPQNEINDGRPILIRFDHGHEGYHCVLGGKLDNVYDAIEHISRKLQL